LDNGIAASGLKVRGSASVLTLNKFGYQLLKGLLRDKVGRCDLGENPESDRHESIRRALEQVRSQYAEIYRLLPYKLARRVYLDLISTLKNQVILADRLVNKDPVAMREFLDLAERTGLLEPWLDPHRGTPNWEVAKTKVASILVYIYKLYNDINRHHHRIDFDDQKLLAFLSLQADDNLAKIATGQYTSVIVDEFQDINRLDFEFIKLLARGKQMIVVGDDDQSIYAFRGCSPDYIINFSERVSREVETHILRTNYRCPKNVVDMGNRLIGQNTTRIKKEQVAHRTDVADVHLWHCLNSASEAQVIARFIKKLHTDRAAKGFRYSDVAVLLRINSQSLPLQIALILEDIPYHCRREENIIVSDLMRKLLGLIDLHLRLRQRPNECSLTDTRLICNCIVRYAPAKDVERFHGEVERCGGYLQLARVPDSVFLPSGLTRADFRRAMENLVKDATPLELVEQISSNFKHLGGMIGSLEDAINNALPLGEIVDIASRFKGDVAQFHELLTGLLEKVEGGLYHSEEGDAVNLLTYFRAKGRQWNTVIIPGANQKIIPLGNCNTEDERRLFYVAITRATSNLIVSFVRHAVRSRVEPSQFIEEMGLKDAEEKRARVLS
jgi:DNA helicase-2/ATP-dependent DNA helicase PcrA